MINLFRQFSRLYITGDDGIPHRLVPFLGAQEIVLDPSAPIIYPLTLLSGPTITPASGPVGTVYTITPARYSGTGPIVYETNILTGNGLVATSDGMASFTYTSTAAGVITVNSRGTGADGIVLPFSSATATSVMPAPPVFTQTPSIAPGVAVGGTPIAINPGVGPNLAWVLTLNGADVTSQVSGGMYTPPLSGGILRLVSTISNARGSISAEAQVLVAASNGPPPDPVEEATITMTTDGFTVQNAGAAPDGTVTVNDDGFTVTPT